MKGSVDLSVHGRLREKEEESVLRERVSVLEHAAKEKTDELKRLKENTRTMNVTALEQQLRHNAVNVCSCGHRVLRFR